MVHPQPRFRHDHILFLDFTKRFDLCGVVGGRFQCPGCRGVFLGKRRLEKNATRGKLRAEPRISGGVCAPALASVFQPVPNTGYSQPLSKEERESK